MRWQLVYGGCSLLLGSCGAYPKYCAKDMSVSAIVPINRPTTARLIQAQIVVRHGARTPCFGDICWERYDEEWNCNAREAMHPQLDQDFGVVSMEFSKIFTAERNIRRGNCSLGQLTDEGFLQEIENAKHFSNAYIGKHGLFDVNEVVDLTNTEDIYFESSDLPRTLQSGQEWTSNPVNVELDKALDEKLIEHSRRSLYDCLMTSRCTDRRLPLTDELFDIVTQREERTAIMQYLYEKSSYAKIGMKSFLEAIVFRLQEATLKRPSLRFALYAAHDSSLMALLAALGGEKWLTEWVPYASHLIIELYETQNDSISSEYAVRFLYQGKPLLFGNCIDELCPLNELIKSVAAMPTCEIFDTTNQDAHVKHIPMMLMLLFGTAAGGTVGFIVARRYFQQRVQYQRLD